MVVLRMDFHSVERAEHQTSHEASDAACHDLNKRP
jgi:hypothetical protein